VYLVWVRVGVAVVAGTMGTINLLDGLGVDLPYRLRIPEARKPGIYRRMRGIVRSEGSLAATLGATAALAAGVSIIEAPCTAGFPVIWSNLVAAQGLTGGEAAPLLGLYLLVYLADELVVFAMAVITLRAASRCRSGTALWLKLAGGTVMLALAVTILAAPQLLEPSGGRWPSSGAPPS
jgi:hypothetical protein